MIVVDRTSFLALLNNVSDSAILRAIDDSDAPMIYLAYETGLEVWLDIVGEHGITGLPGFLRSISAIDLTMVPQTRARSAAAQAIFELVGIGHHPTSRLTLGDCAAYSLALGLSADLVSETSKFDQLGLRMFP